MKPKKKDNTPTHLDAYNDGIQSERERVCKIIEDLIDHYEPYRPITDSPEAQEVRKVLQKLLAKINEEKTAE